jgi:hypothetical protein
MVFRKDEKGGGWHEPPYTWEEEMEFYRRMNAGPQTIYRGPPKPTAKPAPQEPPPQEEDEP